MTPLLEFVPMRLPAPPPMVAYGLSRLLAVPPPIVEATVVGPIQVERATPDGGRGAFVPMTFGIAAADDRIERVRLNEVLCTAADGGGERIRLNAVVRTAADGGV